ncbi:MAG TPA: hypothetical protein VMS54_09310 [Vicinamibacterales bacterium]|nr:hypothetical protein [Vicinamibacterales bacterium]
MSFAAPASVVLTLCLTGGSVFAVGQQQPSASPPRTVSSAAPQPSVLEGLSGLWDYNAELSVDAATGRPEQAPRSAAARQVAPPASAPAVRPPATGGGTPAAPNPAGTSAGGTNAGGSSGGGNSGGGNGGGAVPFDEARRQMAILLAAERRTLLRDLLEVPEKLTIRAAAESVSITDDLKRERVYSTDGKKRKYQLSAATYEATAGWQDSAFRKEIHGTNNFKMTETYVLSEDGKRLFVIIRIGDPKRPETMAGVNRVYDRIS